VRSTAIFARNLQHWLQTQPAFDLAFIIHLKAAAVLAQAGVPYAYEAHEVFAQTPQNAVRQRKLHKLERHVVQHARLRIATSGALAAALSAWYDVPKEDFAIVPNAGLSPLAHSVSSPYGPFVYAGSIADWKGLPVAIHAAREAGVPLRIIGGDDEEWASLREETDTSDIEWYPRVSLHDLPALLSEARAGLIPTNPDTPSGEYSCPMKLFDYARCGLPVVTTALPSLQSLEVGPWCTQVLTSTRIAWTEALKAFQHDAALADEALAWAARHTWEERAEHLKQLFEA
jgi:glycosyltransferase involved in cell wall biosynthesis